MLLKLIKKFTLCAFSMFSFCVLLTLCVSCDSVSTTKVNHEDENHLVDRSKMNHLSNEVKATLDSAHLYQDQGDFEEANQAYFDFIRLSDSLNAMKLNQKIMMMQTSSSVVATQLSSAKMQRKLDERKNNILSIFTITLNTIGTLLLILLIYFIHNHHHLQKYNIKLKETLNKAQEGVRVKENFMHHISHEISNPLRSIVDSSTSLDGLHREDTEMRQYLDIIDESGRKLSDVISGILNVSDLQNKLLKEELVTYNFNQIMVQVIEKYRPRVQEGVEIHYTTSLSKRFTISLRYNSVIIVLNSLLDNAVKYTSKGTITLKTFLDGAKSTLIVTVQDTGVGISDDDEDKVFDLFFKSNGYELGGGAGLFVAQQIAEGRKGSLELDKEYKNGARFIFSLPIEVL